MRGHALRGGRVVRVCLHHLAFGKKLLPVVLGRVSGDLTRPEGDPHGCVGTSHNAKGQEVDQQSHAHVVSMRWSQDESN